jgi:hypothetical protein
MTEQELRKELDEIREQIRQQSPRCFSSDLVLGLQSQLTDIALQVEAHRVVLKALLPEFASRYEAVYSELKKQAVDSGQADYERW